MTIHDSFWYQIGVTSWHITSLLLDTELDTKPVLEIKPKPVTETRVFSQIQNPNLSGRPKFRTCEFSQIQNPTQPVWQIEPKPKPVYFLRSEIRPNLSGRLNPNPNRNLWIFTNPKPNPTCIANWTRTQTRNCSHNKVESKPKPVKFLSSKLQPNLWTKLNPKPTQICTGWVGFHFGSD